MADEYDKPVAGGPGEPPPQPPPPPAAPAPAGPSRWDRVRGWAAAAPLALIASGLIGGLVGGSVVALVGSFDDDDDFPHRYPAVFERGEGPKGYGWDEPFPRERWYRGVPPEYDRPWGPYYEQRPRIAPQPTLPSISPPTPTTPSPTS